MELVGGELNAYTTKEETAIYSTFPAGHLERALSLIAEMVFDATFPEAELAKEKLVVGEEIDTYLDTPSDAIFDDFEDIIYEGSPLSHNILGTRESLSRFDSYSCRRWLEERFTPGRTVFFYSGPTSPEKVFSLAEKHFRGFTRRDNPLNREIPPINQPFSHLNDSRESFQAHTVIGTRIPGLLAPNRLELSLLANIIGGPGMNSLLNVALRERRGLVYSVETSSSMFTGCGMMAVYFGCDPEDSVRCSHLTRDVFRQIADGGLSASRIEKAKKQYIGQIILASDNRENNILAAARTTLFRGAPSNLAATAEAINAVNSAQLRVLAEDFAENSSSLTFGPEI